MGFLLISMSIKENRGYVPCHDGDGDGIGCKPKGANDELADPIEPPTRSRESLN
jgi:hypothetical protein